MRSRSVLVAAFSAALIVGLVRPALAHEEISPKTFPVGQSAFLTLTAANESSSDLVKIALKAPAGLPFGTATRSPAGWTAAVDGTTITWTGGALKPGTYDTWGFETEGANQPGTFTFSVTSTNAGGRTDTHEVEVSAAAPGTGGAAPNPSPVTTATTAPAGAPTTGAATAGSGDEVDENEDSEGASGTAKAALALSIGALVAAGAALALSVRRRGPTAGGAAQSGGGTGPGAAQDW